MLRMTSAGRRPRRPVAADGHGIARAADLADQLDVLRGGLRHQAGGGSKAQRQEPGHDHDETQPGDRAFDHGSTPFGCRSYTATRSIKGSDSGVSAGYSAGRTVGAARCHPLSKVGVCVPGACECAFASAVLQRHIQLELSR